MKHLLSLSLLAVACGGEGGVAHESAVQRGERLFNTDFSGVSCSTCHVVDEAIPSGRLMPGGSLAGVTGRPSYWGGQEDDLLRALNDCRRSFQNVSAPLAATDPDAVDIYAFLDSLPGTPDPIPFTVVRSVSDLPPGDETRGQKVFSSACATCHGTLGSGKGRIDDEVPALPDEVLEEHAQFSEEDRRVIFVEKIRHGGFLGYGGRMPPFSVETLSDEQLSDLLSALGLWPQ
ncbi:MAG TPA: c-type cytochrome [Polyangiaceae bacterium]|nr:c-type cytochrome [Polyangiaceae bacterium]